MRAIVQRVTSSTVSVDGKVCGSIGRGLNVLLGVSNEDTEKDAKYIIDKVSGLRIFEDEQGKMNLSLRDISGQILLVSQFTLYGDTRHGKRPSFIKARSGDEAKVLYEYTVSELRKEFHVETGIFGADMQVEIINDGPVTILLSSEKEF